MFLQLENALTLQLSVSFCTDLTWQGRSWFSVEVARPSSRAGAFRPQPCRRRRGDSHRPLSFPTLLFLWRTCISTSNKDANHVLAVPDKAVQFSGEGEGGVGVFLQLIRKQEWRSGEVSSLITYYARYGAAAQHLNNNIIFREAKNNIREFWLVNTKGLKSQYCLPKKMIKTGELKTAKLKMAPFFDSCQSNHSKVKDAQQWHPDSQTFQRKKKSD